MQSGVVYSFLAFKLIEVYAESVIENDYPWQADRQSECFLAPECGEMKTTT